MRKLVIFLLIIIVLLVGAIASMYHGVPNSNIRLVGISEPATPMKILPIRANVKGAGENPRNIILFIADGMGFSHMAASSLVRHGVHGKGAWEDFAVSGWHIPSPVDGLVIDSAASATAMSTGQATTNRSIGVDKDSAELVTLLEKASGIGYRTGIVSGSHIWDATAASFISHSRSRTDVKNIIAQMANSNLDVLFGALRVNSDSPSMNKESLTKQFSEKFNLIKSLGEIDDIDVDHPVSMLMPEAYTVNPGEGATFVDLTRAAIKRLDVKEGPGYILVIESQDPDRYSHYNDFGKLISGMAVIEDAVRSILEETKNDNETLFIFTSDHETGGLSLPSEMNNNSNLEPIWTTEKHTATAVPLFANGVGAERFMSIHSNYGIGQVLHSMLRIDGPVEEKPVP
jgi:alkaline phosphatase